MVSTNDISPVKTSERFVILDALRGFALLGICMANFPEFSLYTFLSPEAAAAMPAAVADRITRYLLYIFVDGKFYTLFSLLFGIGFSIIIRNAERKGVNGFCIFYRRMGMLLLFGFLHLMFIWSGDILMLYALLGMFLPLFRRVSDKKLLGWALFFLILPIAVDGVCEMTRTNLVLPFIRLQESYCAEYGITEANFACWLHDAEDYGTVFQFLVQGACVRMQEFVIGNRYFKVLGLFLIGFYIGRNRIYADLEGRRSLLVKVFYWGLTLGLPCSLLYAWSSMNGHPFGNTRAVRHRNVPVLWHWLGMGKHYRAVADRSHRISGLPVSNAVQPLVAFQFQIRSVGMGMADADLWEMACYKMNTAY